MSDTDAPDLDLPDDLYWEDAIMEAQMIAGRAWLKRRVPPVAYPPPAYTGRAS